MIVKPIKEISIKEDIIGAINYNTKEEYFDYISMNKNRCEYQELLYL